jgi:ABC-type amino acid transport system permease subunit
MKMGTIVYDCIVILIFSMMALVIAKAERSALCGECFLTLYAPIAAYLLSLVFAIGLCFLNHSRNKNEPAPKWYTFIFYIIAALVIFIVANFAIVILGDALNIVPAIQ